MFKLSCSSVGASFAVVVLALSFAAPAFAWKDPCGISSSPIDCRNYLNGLEYSRERAEEAGKAKAELIAGIEQAREQFWAAYPNKAGATKAREEFAKWLFYKDFYYLRLSLIGSQDRDLTARRGADFMAHILDLSVGLQTVDGGIRQSAKPEFDGWVEAVRSKIFTGDTSNGRDNSAIRGWQSSFTAGEKFWKAMAASEKEYQKYIMERDWWEFDNVHRVPAGFEGSDAYGALLYYRWDNLKMPTALDTYKSMATLLGPDVVRAAAKTVRDAPKNERGELVVTVAAPYKTGPGGSQVIDDDVPMPETVIGTYGDPVKAMEILATQGDDRRYLLYLLAGENVTNRHTIDRATQWTFAGTAYDRLVLAFGKPDVLQAADLIRLATKRMTNGHAMNPKAIGATRGRPFDSFADILTRKNPRGYVRFMLILNGNLDTPAAVDSAYKDLLSEYDETDVLDAAREMAAGRPYPLYKSELADLRNALDSDDSTEDETPAPAEVDYPKYLAWKGFAPGAKATYAFRGLRQAGPASDRFIPGQVSVRQTFLLQSVDDQLAKLWLTEVVYDYPSGQAHPPHDTEIAYPPKYAPPQTPPAAPTESGNEALMIAGKSLATRWEKVQSTGYGCGGTVTTWTSDEVPGGLVRQTEEDNCSNPTTIRETILESFQGDRTRAAAAPEPK